MANGDPPHLEFQMRRRTTVVDGLVRACYNHDKTDWGQRIEYFLQEQGWQTQ
jgi:hypothetical protein